MSLQDVSTAMAGFHSMSIHSEGSQLVSGSFEGDVKLWDLKTGQCSLTLKVRSWSVKSIN